MNTEANAAHDARAARQRTSHQGRKLKNEGTRMACPHCDAQAEIRTSRVVSKTMRELIYACTNVECGHTFVAATEVLRTLSPSATPDPAVNIPLSSHVNREMVRIVLDHAAESAHQPQYTAPTTGDLFAGPRGTS
ncbi:ogr/Delta-like zinc finger family protein [Paracidovorax konjaci]|uniref:Ogr/Delta-like zinc finger n=1 Tax=Paracidovorax konjaci TaxID=32040 RepID=A0A1I1XQM8_9BURK|nr:ogr/Delta-like zinc finger family protein [Paracidovorax konjaci]SFE09629.1 Ogr/Delta-like zinc finger [Paracidovorax konjaci]